jgi:hypothetical protein
MSRADNTNEWDRLRKLYSASSDGELLELAKDAGSLTEAARTALFQEFGARGLSIPQPKTRGFAEPELQKLVMVQRFRDLPEALLAKGRLDSAGIESFLSDDNVIRMDWFWSNGVGGLKLMVREEDADSAKAVLSAPAPSEFEVEGAGHYRQPRCSKCKSEDIKLAAGWTNQFWKCDSCGHEWPADMEESEK